jgi:cystathionine beta-lyase
VKTTWSPDDFVNLDRAALENRPGAKWQMYGHGTLSMWVADMDFPMTPMAVDAIEAHMATGDFGYPMRSVKDEVAQQFASRMLEKCGWTIDPEDVRIAQDVIQALQAVLMTCTEPGDAVTMQTPIYHPFLNSIRDMGRPLVDNPWIKTETGWDLDLEGLRAALSATPAKMMILCNPHNPTGRVFTRSELEGLAEVVLEHDLLVIADEIHSDLIHDGGTHIPFASLSTDVSDRTITLNAASKAFNLAGLKMSVAHTTSPVISAKLDALPGHLFGGPNTFGMKTTLACWRDGDEWLAAVLDRLTSNRNLLSDLFDEHIPEIVFRKPQATYLGWIDCTALDLGGAQPSKFFLEHARLALNDGNEFGVQGKGHCRMNFATGPEIITEAVERMAAAIN